MGVSRVFQECFKNVSRKMIGCFKVALREFQEYFDSKGVSRKFQGIFEKGSKVLQGNLREFSRDFQGRLENILKNIQDVSKEF